MSYEFEQSYCGRGGWVNYQDIPLVGRSGQMVEFTVAGYHLLN